MFSFCVFAPCDALQVSEQIKDLLTSKAVEMYISIDDIAITHLVFDEEFTNAIERKQVAQQDVERVKVRFLAAVASKYTRRVLFYFLCRADAVRAVRRAEGGAREAGGHHSL